MNSGFLYYLAATARNALTTKRALPGSAEGMADIIRRVSSTAGDFDAAAIGQMISDVPMPPDYRPSVAELERLLDCRSAPPTNFSDEEAEGWAHGQEALLRAVGAANGESGSSAFTVLRSIASRLLSSWP